MGKYKGIKVDEIINDYRKGSMIADILELVRVALEHQFTYVELLEDGELSKALDISRVCKDYLIEVNTELSKVSLLTVSYILEDLSSYAYSSYGFMIRRFSSANVYTELDIEEFKQYICNGNIAINL